MQSSLLRRESIRVKHSLLLVELRAQPGPRVGASQRPFAALLAHACTPSVKIASSFSLMVIETVGTYRAKATHLPRLLPCLREKKASKADILRNMSM